MKPWWIKNRRDESIGTASARGRSFLTRISSSSVNRGRAPEEKQHIELAKTARYGDSIKVLFHK
ncbi:hypothetical protein WJ0W_004285 [Paenibacillus melissococcoides]|uniref:Uncharacterized protein n=1 Tax=Paenibacillus melissococcoides TaxID=2912268 RepID=A0ABM9G5J4_9BACL|nr:hypothetical protein WJ0W_004285 [Paenibacillus melissococcoides]